MMEQVRGVAKDLERFGDHTAALHSVADAYRYRPLAPDPEQDMLQRVLMIIVEDLEIDDTFNVAALAATHPRMEQHLFAIVNSDEKDKPLAFASKLNLRAACLGPDALRSVSLLVRSKDPSPRTLMENQTSLRKLRDLLVQRQPHTLFVVVQSGSYDFHAKMQTVIRESVDLGTCDIKVDCYFGRDNLKAMTQDEAIGWRSLANAGFTDHNRFVFFQGNAAGGNLGKLCPGLESRLSPALQEACRIYTVLFTGQTLTPTRDNMLEEKKLAELELKRQDFVDEVSATFEQGTLAGDLADYAALVLHGRFAPALPGYKREILDAILNKRFEGPSCDILISVSELLHNRGLAERFEGTWSLKPTFTSVDPESQVEPLAVQFRLPSPDFAPVSAVIEQVLASAAKHVELVDVE